MRVLYNRNVMGRSVDVTVDAAGSRRFKSCSAPMASVAQWTERQPESSMRQLIHLSTQDPQTCGPKSSGYRTTLTNLSKQVQTLQPGNMVPVIPPASLACITQRQNEELYQGGSKRSGYRSQTKAGTAGTPLLTPYPPLYP